MSNSNYRYELDMLATGAAFVADLMKKSSDAFDRGDYRDAVHFCDRLICLVRQTGVPAPMVFLAVPMMNKAHALYHLDRREESLGLYEEVISGFTESTAEDTGGHRANAQLCRAVALRGLVDTMRHSGHSTTYGLSTGARPSAPSRQQERWSARVSCLESCGARPRRLMYMTEW